MKIKEQLIRRLEISEVKGLDPIRVMLEDIAPSQGRINIECWGKSWASYWGGMGGDTISEFFRSCDEHYLAKNLSPGINTGIFDPDHLKDTLKREIIAERRKMLIGKSEAREQFDKIEDLGNLPETIDGLWYVSEVMVDLLGDEWWYRLPEKPNPDYTYLCRIIQAVQQALRSVEVAA